MNKEWTDGDKRLLQLLVQHKVVGESDLLNWFKKLVLQQGVTNTSELKECFTARVAKYKEKLELLGLTLSSIWVQEKDTFYWSIVNTRDDDVIAQKTCKYNDTDIVVLKTIIDYFLEKEDPTEQLDKRDLLSLLDRLEKKPRPLEVDGALNKLSKDQWVWLQTRSHRVYVQLSPRTILELPHVFQWYLSHTNKDDSV